MKKQKVFLVCIMFILSLLVLKPLEAVSQSVGETSGHIELTENNTPTPPVNPEDPSQKLQPVDPYNPGTNNPGPLSIDVAPINFEFGVQKMYVSEHIYEGISQGRDHVRQYIQITDARNAGINGWKVTVKQDRYLSSDSYTLMGATLILPAGDARNSLNIPPTAIDSNLKTESVEVNMSEATLFKTLTDDRTTGKGQSVTVWEPNQVRLKVPENTAKAGNYSNTLTWTLTAVANP
ncbi:WxL domain-containing protein [Enterococcus sp. LJL128]|uniref:WxL domain-containing protein n=1 Tax=Enterococcus sp. LJL51 TaxID=3416656 RepID=UPI003CF1D418